MTKFNQKLLKIKKDNKNCNNQKNQKKTYHVAVSILICFGFGGLFQFYFRDLFWIVLDFH